MPDSVSPDATPAVELSGLFVQPIARRIADWTENGKLDEDGLDVFGEVPGGMLPADASSRLHRAALVP
ncbi:MAG: hypothetical protein CL931_00185 [Deltaproteobacteria bacterium]|nr:hypothetical protein [Deltaproteobacteria bacterium]